jgi:hypothetical protein
VWRHDDKQSPSFIQEARRPQSFQKTGGKETRGKEKTVPCKGQHQADSQIGLAA